MNQLILLVILPQCISTPHAEVSKRQTNFTLHLKIPNHWLQHHQPGVLLCIVSQLCCARFDVAVVLPFCQSTAGVWHVCLPCPSGLHLRQVTCVCSCPYILSIHTEK